MSGRATVVLSVLLCVVLFGSLMLFSRWRRDERLESGSGDLHHAVLVQAEPPTLLSIEALEFSSEDDDEIVYRVTSWDARTGKRLARLKEVAWRKCASAGAGLVWCLTDKDELEVLRVPTLTLAHGAAEVSAKVGQKVMNATQLDVSEAGRLRATLADGRKVELSADTLALSPQSPEAQRPSSPSPRVYACSIANSERLGLCERVEYGKEQRVDTGDGWLRLRVVSELPDGWILAVNTSLDDAVNERRLVRLDATFKELGSTTIGKVASWATLEPMWVTPNELFLVSSPETHSTIGVDAQTGTERFRIAH